jgi:hypothetical protein
MANWTDIPDDVFDVDEPVVGATHLAILKNITALAEGAAGAPKITPFAVNRFLPVTATLQSTEKLTPEIRLVRGGGFVYPCRRITGTVRVVIALFGTTCYASKNGATINAANPHNFVVAVTPSDTLEFVCLYDSEGTGLNQWATVNILVDDPVVELAPICYESQLL